MQIVQQRVLMESTVAYITCYKDEKSATALAQYQGIFPVQVCNAQIQWQVV